MAKAKAAAVNGRRFCLPNQCENGVKWAPPFMYLWYSCCIRARQIIPNTHSLNLALRKRQWLWQEFDLKIMLVTGRVPLPWQLLEVFLKEPAGLQAYGWWSSWYLFWGKEINPGQGDGASEILQEANLGWVVDLDCFVVSCLIQPKLVEERGWSQISAVSVLLMSIIAIEFW